MREPVDDSRIRIFMQRLGAEADAPGRLYFTGGATAVLMGWRASTIDIDIKLLPDSDALFRAIPPRGREGPRPAIDGWKPALPAGAAGGTMGERK